MDQSIYNETEHELLQCFHGPQELKPRDICTQLCMKYKTVLNHVHHAIRRGLIESTGGRFATYTRTMAGTMKMRAYNRHVRALAARQWAAEHPTNTSTATPHHINIYALPVLHLENSGFQRNDGHKNIHSHGYRC